MKEQDQIVIYQSEDGQNTIDVKLDGETVWLSLNQLATLFGRDKSVISRHMKNIYETNELIKDQTVAFFATVQKEGKKEVKRNIEYYNLDAIISLGYRVNSKRGVQFRIWATHVLKQHLIKGYSIYEKRLEESEHRYHELKRAIKLLKRTADKRLLSSEEATGIMSVLEKYSYALDTLDRYDHQSLQINFVEEAALWKLTYETAKEQIEIWRRFQNAGKLFGNEKDDSFRGSLQAIYQTFNGEDLYPSIEEKAANLLYFVVKNHSFSDGNKRIAAGLFVYFLDMNKRLFRPDGEKRIADNALVAITIMIAESKSEEKEMMIKLVVNLINQNN